MSREYKTVSESVSFLESTGEIVTSEKRSIKRIKRKKFTMLYHDTIASLNGLMNLEGRVFAQLLKRATYPEEYTDSESMEYRVHLSASLKKKIAIDSGVGGKDLPHRVNDIISRLAKKGMLIIAGGGEYILNPEIIGYTSDLNHINKLKTRYQIIRIAFDSKDGTATVKTVISDKNEFSGKV